MDNFNPVRGMRDFLPNEINLREKIKKIILKKYEEHGFNLIETPTVENLSFLQKSTDESDNQKLIFKILKRGQKLDFSNLMPNASLNANLIESELSDLGLRFDLTIPLMRYYQNNKHLLPKIFKAIQIGNVWRAERPQNGRYRQFIQCDIDIIGSDKLICEFELITIIIEIFNELLSSKFTIKINDRRILNNIIDKCSLHGNKNKFFAIIDKIDKIGLERAMEELKNIFSDENIESFKKCINNHTLNEETKILIDQCKAYQNKFNYNCDIIFDPLLARGMGYYTGIIFEVTVDNFGFSISGGGRYNNLITNTPACGISIGFERLLEIIKLENNIHYQNDIKKIAIVIDSNNFMDILDKLDTKKFDVISLMPYPDSKSNQSKLKSCLAKEGYRYCYICSRNYQSWEIEELFVN